MKRIMLLMLGLGLFVVSCKKQETNENNSMTDSAKVSGTAMSSDSAGTAGDSTMNQGNMQNNKKSTSTDQTNGANGGTPSNGGAKVDSVK